MVVVQSRSRRKPTGGRYTSTNPKKIHQVGRAPALTKRSTETRTRTFRTKGGSEKTRLLQAETVNLLDPKTKKSSTEAIEQVTSNPANRHFVRRNILTKGTIIETAKGRAQITSRPGQEGAINAVLITEE